MESMATGFISWKKIKDLHKTIHSGFMRVNNYMGVKFTPTKIGVQVDIVVTSNPINESLYFRSMQSKTEKVERKKEKVQTTQSGMFDNIDI
ncbi:MAG: hypothetical protein ACQESN_08735 [Thermotogota bacterium]